jgi:hypothetical protein
LAARLAAWFAKNPFWLAVQRLGLGFVLAAPDGAIDDPPLAMIY